MLNFHPRKAYCHVVSNWFSCRFLLHTLIHLPKKINRTYQMYLGYFILLVWKGNLKNLLEYS